MAFVTMCMAGTVRDTNASSSIGVLVLSGNERYEYVYYVYGNLYSLLIQSRLNSIFLKNIYYRLTDCP